MSSYLMELVILFLIYSFMGWILETAYASIVNKKFINRGFLSGPFCPIYGCGAILIIQSAKLIDGFFINIPYVYSAVVKIVLSIVLTTLLEYFTGAVLERAFGCKWWDYSDEPLNIKGRICLKYSILWGMLAYILIEVIHPVCYQVVARQPLVAKYAYSLFAISYFMYDTAKSVNEMLNLRQTILSYHKISAEQFFDRIAEYERIFLAFPKLYFHRIGKINQEIRGFLNEKMEKLKAQLKIR